MAFEGERLRQCKGKKRAGKERVRERDRRGQAERRGREGSGWGKEKERVRERRGQGKGEGEDEGEGEGEGNERKARAGRWQGGNGKEMRAARKIQEKKEKNNKHEGTTRQPASRTMSGLWLLRENG